MLSLIFQSRVEEEELNFLGIVFVLVFRAVWKIQKTEQEVGSVAREILTGSFS